MPFLSFFLNIAALIQFEKGTLASKCPSSFGINVTVEFNDSHIISNCTSISSSLNANRAADSGRGINNYWTPNENEFREQENTMKEDIKNEILMKLGISAPPPPENRYEIPLKEEDAIYVKNLLQPDFIRNETHFPEYKYRVLFPQHATIVSPLNGPQSFFSTYKSSENFDVEDIETIELWFFNSKYNESYNIFPITITETTLESKHLVKRFIHALVEGGKWVRVPLNKTRTVIKLNSLDIYRITIYCETYNDTIIPANISYGMNPFIAIKMKASLNERIVENYNRNRHYKIMDACKREITFDFKSLGWDKWILFPNRFSTNYCRGSCTGDFDENFCTYPSVTRISDRRNESPFNAPPSICCAPLSASSIEIVYIDGPFHMYNFVFTTIPDMIVEECGCIWDKPGN